MIYEVLAVRDRAISEFGTPIFVAHIGQAIRSFSDAINTKDAKDNLAMHPEDFDLFHIGSYDGATGILSSLEHPRQVAVGKDCVRS